MSIYTLLAETVGDLTLKMESNINENLKRHIYGPQQF